MKRMAVVNASPLIVLARIGRLGLLTEVGGNLVVPSGVAHEIMQGGPRDPARRWIVGDGRRYIKRVRQTDDLVAAWDLGLGESHVLTWALTHEHCEALLDDAAARTCAKTLGINVCGTLGLLMRAKRVGLIMAVKPLFGELTNAGFYVGAEMLDAILEIVGER